MTKNQVPLPVGFHSGAATPENPAWEPPASHRMIETVSGWLRPKVPPLPLEVVGVAIRWIISNQMALETAKMTREEANFAVSKGIGTQVTAEQFALLLDAADVAALWLTPAPPEAGKTLESLAKAVRDLERAVEYNRQAIEWNARRLADFITETADRIEKLERSAAVVNDRV